MNETTAAQTLECFGMTVVGSWLGVGRAAVSKWCKEYDNTPVPATTIDGRPGWLLSSKPEWHRWYTTAGPGRPSHEKRRHLRLVDNASDAATRQTKRSQQAMNPFVYNAQVSACSLFPLCDNRIEGTVTNPIMGEIPSCERCAGITGQTLNPIPSGAKPMIRFTSATELPQPVTEIPPGSEITYFVDTNSKTKETSK